LDKYRKKGKARYTGVLDGAQRVKNLFPKAIGLVQGKDCFTAIRSLFGQTH
jgi:hypothetical protein